MLDLKALEKRRLIEEYKEFAIAAHERFSKAYAALSKSDKELAFKPNLIQKTCPICGQQVKEYHHVIPLSTCDVEGVSPIITLCHECHGKAHEKKLHFKWGNNLQWWYLNGENAPFNEYRWKPVPYLEDKYV